MKKYINYGYQEGEWLYYRNKLGEHIGRYAGTSMEYVNLKEVYSLSNEGRTHVNTDNTNTVEIQDTYKATPKQIERILSQVSKNYYGFYKGIDYIPVFLSKITFKFSPKLKYISEDDSLVVKGDNNAIIYKKGRWAKIIPERFVLLKDLPLYKKGTIWQKGDVSDLGILYCKDIMFNVKKNKINHNVPHIWNVKGIKNKVFDKWFKKIE